MFPSVIFRRAVATIPIVSYIDQPHAKQRDVLRGLIHDHEASVQANAARACTTHPTYVEDRALYFPAYHLIALPPTSGAHREAVRAGMADPAFVNSLQTSFLSPWGKRAAPASDRGWPRQGVIFGCKSVPYLERQLVAATTEVEREGEGGDSYAFVVVDHSLKALANAAARLVPRYADRVRFMRSDAIFPCLRLFPEASADVVVAPMPAPFWGEKNSHQRLVTCDFLCAVHRILRERTFAQDPRGFVTFTDCEPYADFIMEQLAEAKLLVPWVRKNPAEAYGRWLPLAGRDKAGEFPQQRFQDVVAIAASKSGQPSPQAARLIESYDYRRKYYRSFNGEPGEES